MDEILKHKEVFLRDINTVYQYKFADIKPVTRRNTSKKCIKNKLLTIFGEDHNKILKCKDFSIDVSEFILRSLKLNKNIKIFLEYDAGLKYDFVSRTINSFNLRNTINILDKNRLITSIIPVDCRNYYLGTYFHHELYHNPKMNLHIDYINNHYIKPFLGRTIHISKDVIPEYKYILEDYLLELKTDFEYLRDNWNNIIPPFMYKYSFPYNIVKLRDTWAKVVDFYILEEIFKDNDINEYICLIGDGHRINIQNYISKLFKVKSDHQEINRDKCISINKMRHGTLPTYILLNLFDNI